MHRTTQLNTQNNTIEYTEQHKYIEHNEIHTTKLNT